MKRRCHKKSFYTRLLSITLSIFLAISPAAATAAAVPDGVETITVEESLSNNPTAHSIVRSEKEMLAQALEEGMLTRQQLNALLLKMSQKTNEELAVEGYSTERIEIIKSYCEGTDAFTHVFGNHMSRATDATLDFRFGLIENDGRRAVKIGYVMTWSDFPFFQLEDSYGIGWIAANASSIPLATKIDDYSQTVDYYYTGTGEYWWSTSFETRTTAGQALVGIVDMLGPGGGYQPQSYGKVIRGTIDVSTQSDSNNMDTIQIFVNYQHTVFTLDFSFEVALTPAISKIPISFIFR